METNTRSEILGEAFVKCLGIALSPLFWVADILFWALVATGIAVYAGLQESPNWALVITTSAVAVMLVVLKFYRFYMDKKYEPRIEEWIHQAMQTADAPSYKRIMIAKKGYRKYSVWIDHCQKEEKESITEALMSIPSRIRTDNTSAQDSYHLIAV